MSSKEKYTVILPTYNERRNLPISTIPQTEIELSLSVCVLTHTLTVTWLLNRTFAEK